MSFRRANIKSTTSVVTIICASVALCYIWHRWVAKGQLGRLKGIEGLKGSKGFETDIGNHWSAKEGTLSLLVVTRVHMQAAKQMPDPEKLLKFVRNSNEYASSILVCVGSSDFASIEVYINRVKLLLENNHLAEKVTLLPIQPWGYFIFPLNVALQVAQDRDCERIAFQSVEFQLSSVSAKKLLQLSSINSNILVIGPEMKGHEFTEGINILTGRSCPWNTFALWNVDHLARTGFPMIGDGVASNRAIGGVEEVSAISLLQHIDPTLLALLVRFPEATLNWNTKFDDKEREQYHKTKMASKNERPAEQMRVLNVPAGNVHHIIL